jgi:hypothetical protein
MTELLIILVMDKYKPYTRVNDSFSAIHPLTDDGMLSSTIANFAINNSRIVQFG